MKLVADYFALIENDLDVAKWQESFYWPLKAEESTLLSQDLENAFKDLVNDRGDGFGGDVLLIGHRLHTFAAMFLYRLQFLQRFRAQGYEVVASGQDPILAALARGRLPERPGEMALDQPGGRKRGLWPSLGRWRRELAYNGRSGGLGLNTLPRRRDRLPVVARPQRVVLERRFTRSLGRYVAFWDRFDFFPLDQTSAVEPEASLRGAVEEWLDRLEIVAQEHDIDLEPGHRLFLRSLSAEYLGQVAAIYHQIQRRLRGRRPIHFLAGPAGPPLVRALSLAVRRRGGRATGFLHGDTSSPERRYFMPLFDLSTVDQYVVYTEAGARHMAQMAEEFRPARDNPVDIISENTTFFGELWASKRRLPRPSKIRRVMLVDVTVSSNNIHRNKPWQLIYVDFLIRLIEFLKGRGFEVIYKRHPDILAQGWADDFFGLCQTTFEPFEKVMDQGEAYLFFSTTSTIFHHAVCTNRPILLFNNKLEEFFPDAEAGLRQRCFFIESWFDERNRWRFDEEEVLEALKTAPREPDMSYFNSHLTDKPLA